MKIVLDTNVWLSALFWNGEANKIVELAEKKKVSIVITEKMINEITDVLEREPKFQNSMENKNLKIEELIRTILYMCEFVDSKIEINIVKEDPDDNRIIEAALDGKAKYVISYDNHLLKLKEFRKIKIIHPTDFLKKIKT